MARLKAFPTAVCGVVSLGVAPARVMEQQLVSEAMEAVPAKVQTARTSPQVLPAARVKVAQAPLRMSVVHANLQVRGGAQTASGKKPLRQLQAKRRQAPKP
jgi:hypothetical protein